MNTCSPFWRPYTALRAAGRLSSSHQVYRSYLHSSARDRKYNGLRILFCGADNFSIESLRAVHGLQEKQPDKIASIEVVCRPDKRVGRGLKQIREVPIKGVAHELGLPIHHLDTFNNWTLPSPFDLIVAVSFGLLVPARIINATTYGGLNVHPSLLPDLRGAAPIQHAILGGRHYTGVSVQTMHPTKFDCGEVIAQTPLPGIRIAHETTTEDLINQLAPLGATMLRNSIDRGLFISPKTVLRKEEINPRSLEPAPKITPEDGHINWDKWTAHRILRANRALGRLWDTTTVQRCNAQSQETRVSYDGKWKLVEAQKIEAFGISDPLRAGSPVRVVSSGTDQVDIALATVDGQFVMPESITIAGQGKGKGGSHLLRLMNYM